MLDCTITFHNVKSIEADADGRFLQLVIQREGVEDTDRLQMLRFDVGRPGKALLMAGALNSIQEADVSPIYPAEVRRIA